jgi:phosphate starvation-inducible protein PhoH and related proteins
MSSKKQTTTSDEIRSDSQLQDQIRENEKPRTLKIKHKKFTDKQKNFVDIGLADNTNMMFINGPAGSAKTYISIYCGLKLLSEQKVEELVYIRNAVESSDHKLGFLPGAQDDKMAPYLEPLKDKLEEFLSIVDIKYLQEDNRIYGVPVGFLRGASWTDKFVIVDEAQNMTEKELITIMTRVGENTRVFICGDTMQSDIGNKSGFANIQNLFNDESSKEQGIFTFEFDEDDIIRSKLVKFIVRRIKSLR